MSAEIQVKILEKLDKIEEKQVQHTVQLALNNSILEEHHRRSTNLERRLHPVEQHVLFLNKLIKLVAMVFAGASAATAVISLFFK